MTPTETTTRRSLTLIVPGTPGQPLSPNRTRGRGWHDKSIRRAERDLAWATLVAFRQAPPQHAHPYPRTPPIDVSIRVYWESGRHEMDRDNLLASCKRGLIDRIADEIEVDDKHFRYPEIEQNWDPDGRGYMLVRITEGE